VLLQRWLASDAHTIAHNAAQTFDMAVAQRLALPKSKKSKTADTLEFVELKRKNVLIP